MCYIFTLFITQIIRNLVVFCLVCLYKNINCKKDKTHIGNKEKVMKTKVSGGG